VLDEMDMATADGMAVVWVMRLLGHRAQQRINGPDLMWRCCECAEALGLSVYFLGSTEDTLAQLRRCVSKAFPKLRIAGVQSLPFRPMTETEDQALESEVNASGANFVFVSLGCPKQEAWIARRRGRISSVMLGVGAAFDFHSGRRKRAPQWIQDHGLEWLYRLVCEPRRLSGRYFSTNSSFIVGAARQLSHARTDRSNADSA
jgi:N-acetylglucosaminyldiphosphoundecaprenol N-acetyl-beta-D-mannosaminyltransferase